MSLFKKAVLFSIDNAINLTKENIENALRTKKFDPDAVDLFSTTTGFNEFENGKMAFELNECFFFEFEITTKRVPPKVISQYFQRKISKMENPEEVDKDKLFCEIHDELIGKTFAVSQKIMGFFDIKLNILVVNINNDRQIEFLKIYLSDTLNISFKKIPFTELRNFFNGVFKIEGVSLNDSCSIKSDISNISTKNFDIFSLDSFYRGWDVKSANFLSSINNCTFTLNDKGHFYSIKMLFLIEAETQLEKMMVEMFFISSLVRNTFYPIITI